MGTKRHFLTDDEKVAIGMTCRNCGATNDLQYHHIVPIACGGRDTLDNMVCLCADCHSLIHYGEKGRIAHGYQVKRGIAAARERGVNVGKKPADYEKVMRLIAEHSTQFNAASLETEHEIMAMAEVGLTTYAKCKRMLLNAMNAEVWPYGWRKPKQIRPHPEYEHVIRKVRGDYHD